MAKLSDYKENQFFLENGVCIYLVENGGIIPYMIDKKPTKGQITKKKYIVHWESEKIMAFIDFSQFFMKIGVYEGIEQNIYDCTSEKIEQMRLSNELYFKEFITCLDGKDMTPKTFTLRLKNFLRNVSDVLRENPALISQEIEMIIKGNTKWKSSLLPFPAKDSIIPQKRAVINHPTTLLDYYNQGLNESVRVYELLLKGINESDIRKINIDKRIRLANNMTHSLSKAVKEERNTKVFNTLVINNTSREELERSMLDYVESQNQIE